MAIASEARARGVRRACPPSLAGRAIMRAANDGRRARRLQSGAQNLQARSCGAATRRVEMERPEIEVAFFSLVGQSAALSEPTALLSSPDRAAGAIPATHQSALTGWRRGPEEHSFQASNTRGMCAADPDTFPASPENVSTPFDPRASAFRCRLKAKASSGAFEPT